MHWHYDFKMKFQWLPFPLHGFFKRDFEQDWRLFFFFYVGFACQDDEDLQQMKLKITPGSKSLLAQPIQQLVQLLFDVESMQNALIEFEVRLSPH